MNRKLALRDCQAIVTFRNVDSRFRTDPVLSRVVKRWCSFTGDDNETTPPAQGELPYVRLSAFGSPALRADEITSRCVLNVAVTIVCDGTRMDDPLNLYDQMRRVIFPGDSSTLAFNTANRIEVVNVGTPVVGVIDATESKMLEAKGSFTFLLYFDTMQ